MKKFGDGASGILRFIGKYKYILIALAVGAVLLLLPRTASGQARDAPTSAALTGLNLNSESGVSEAKLTEVLSRLDGAGGITVALSKSGAVIVCPNVNPELRLGITQAVSAYTGLSSEKIIILKGASK
ncbi:MAG: hypothetical protein LBN43_02415 [Oscillospiraceae bacterium]|jgi:hypothetical protein|nr:hypothetical protein [Oscillospiraceae bacterium]